MKTKEQIEGILNRVKEVNKCTSDIDLAALLGVSRSTLSNWKVRGTIDYDLVFSFCEHSDLHWIITGNRIIRHSNKQENTTIAAEPPVTYKSIQADLESLADKKELIETQRELIRALKHRISTLESSKSGFNTAHYVESTGEI